MNLIDRHNVNIIFQEHLNDGPAIRNLNRFQFLQQLCFESQKRKTLAMSIAIGLRTNVEFVPS